MKTRESGMPEESLWEGFFVPDATLRRLKLAPTCKRVVEFGCGYGTFTIPAARLVSGVVFAVDIDPAMVDATQNRAAAAGLSNVLTNLRDVASDGVGIAPASCDYAMLFNILHAEVPSALLAEAYRVIAPGGILGIMHWNYDPSTPRGPSMDIRPKPEQLVTLALDAGFDLLPPGVIDLPPYHYGMAAQRPTHS